MYSRLSRTIQTGIAETVRSVRVKHLEHRPETRLLACVFHLWILAAPQAPWKRYSCVHFRSPEDIYHLSEIKNHNILIHSYSLFAETCQLQLLCTFSVYTTRFIKELSQCWRVQAELNCVTIVLRNVAKHRCSDWMPGPLFELSFATVTWIWWSEFYTKDTKGGIYKTNT